MKGEQVRTQVWGVFLKIKSHVIKAKVAVQMVRAQDTVLGAKIASEQNAGEII